MKTFRIINTLTIIGFALIFLGANIAMALITDKENTNLMVDMNRMAIEFQELLNEEDMAPTEALTLIKESRSNTLGERLKVYFDNVYMKENEDRLNRLNDEEIYAWSIYDKEGVLLGLLYFQYEKENKILPLINICIVAVFVLVMTCNALIYRAYISPFRQLEEYPEKISKGYVYQHIPETRYRHLGKFVWGMNMLADVLENDRRSLNAAEAERQTLLTGVAHGVKTPVANIKLYSEAIETGLYQEDGIPDKKDAEIAGKIKENATDIERLIKELIETSSKGVYGFTPEFKMIYIREIAESLEREFGNRFKVNRIPYVISCEENFLINVDQRAVMTVLSQFLENAFKYGNGQGVKVILEKQEEDVYFIVLNKGKLLPENEMSSIFKSFWRGSNSDNVEGSGMGMYMAKEMAGNIGGEVFARRILEGDDDIGEMEFELIIPLR